mmetsp:Transcript_147316/g.473308  ORF Transcript_147316/g.473308 Transcript_147316/m.473308 type:complete len:240 (+) Transcript_147316:222-941(+)
MGCAALRPASKPPPPLSPVASEFEELDSFNKNAKSFCMFATVFSSAGDKGGANKSPKAPSGLFNKAGPIPGNTRSGDTATSCLANAFRPPRPRQSMPFTVSSARKSRKNAPSFDSKNVNASREASPPEFAVASAHEVGRSPTRRSAICSRRRIVSVRFLSCTRPTTTAPPSAGPSGCGVHEVLPPPPLAATEAAAALATATASSVTGCPREGNFSVMRNASKARSKSIKRSASKVPSRP